MKFKTEEELRALYFDQLEEEKAKVQRKIASPRFFQDPERQLISTRRPTQTQKT